MDQIREVGSSSLTAAPHGPSASAPPAPARPTRSATTSLDQDYGPPGVSKGHNIGLSRGTATLYVTEAEFKDLPFPANRNLRFERHSSSHRMVARQDEPEPAV